MLTLQMLKDMDIEQRFATGLAMDEPDGLFMSGSGRPLRWVAIRGRVHDWSIYCHFAKFDEDYVAKSGDKVCNPKHIKMLVPCDEEAFAMYRL